VVLTVVPAMPTCWVTTLSPQRPEGAALTLESLNVLGVAVGGPGDLPVGHAALAVSRAAVLGDIRVAPSVPTSGVGRSGLGGAAGRPQKRPVEGRDEAEGALLKSAPRGCHTNHLTNHVRTHNRQRRGSNGPVCTAADGPSHALCATGAAPRASPPIVCVKFPWKRVSY
jgi:hypothetical protein